MGVVNLESWTRPGTGRLLSQLRTGPQRLWEAMKGLEMRGVTQPDLRSGQIILAAAGGWGGEFSANRTHHPLCTVPSMEAHPGISLGGRLQWSHSTFSWAVLRRIGVTLRVAKLLGITASKQSSAVTFLFQMVGAATLRIVWALGSPVCCRGLPWNFGQSFYFIFWIFIYVFFRAELFSYTFLFGNVYINTVKLNFKRHDVISFGYY